MALDPAVLLADEPVASLDASIRGEILALMRSFVDDHGVSIIVVTHDLGLAWNIADRVAVMYLGRIVELGPTEEVLADPQHPYTRALLSVVPETRRHGAADPAGRDTRPEQGPHRLPVPPALPGGRLGRGRPARHRVTVPRRGPGAHRSQHRPHRRLPPLTFQQQASAGEGVGPGAFGELLAVSCRRSASVRRGTPLDRW